ncbi:hypothetical protein C8A03DRAFT_48457 [Achaetomium macrosporum]|uniref:C2H2-type domain-containing protein n=1 Tax=Achaetomium macrosporum TaxID=79813 RepID=A0AAN7C1D3_9PEZI|nr:hypothetical protein C8A03DRAFT_48457 [Achaetomium macrosporum]
MEIPPFVHLPEYPFVICKECRFACVANEVPSHLRNHHDSVKAQERAQIARTVTDIPGIIHSQAQLRGFADPPATTEPTPFIAPPQANGLRCDTCGYIARRGGNVVKRAKQERTLPWTAGIRCQRFFPTRAGSQWFEVGRGSEVPSVGAVEVAKETVEQRITRIHQAQAQRFKTRSRQVIEAGDDRPRRTRGYGASGGRSIYRG